VRPRSSQVCTAWSEQENEMTDVTTVGAEVASAPLHPWRRYFSKMLDVCLLGAVPLMLIGIGLASVLPGGWTLLQRASEHDIVGMIVMLVVWIAFETVLLATLGTTPARWLFGITVRSSVGAKLAFRDALERAVSLAFKGLGLGIPPVQLITCIFAYRRLSRTRTTLWDADASSTVIHARWGVGRAIACTMSIVLLFAAIFFALGASQ
jgi:hypothetical protein